MVKQTNTKIAREINKTSTAFPDHASVHQSIRKEKHHADDIIMSLSNAYENKRARQVFEWERKQSVTLRQAA
ncbi:MAG: hypothetical protein ACT4O9_17145 [Blastocatellia bacterium]